MSKLYALKTMSVAAVLSASMAAGAMLAPPAFAQSRTVPQGDAIDLTPPIDLTIGQVLNARPDDRAVIEGRSAYEDRPMHRMRQAPEEIDR